MIAYLSIDGRNRHKAEPAVLTLISQTSIVFSSLQASQSDETAGSGTAGGIFRGIVRSTEFDFICSGMDVGVYVDRVATRKHDSGVVVAYKADF